MYSSIAHLALASRLLGTVTQFLVFTLQQAVGPAARMGVLP